VNVLLQQSSPEKNKLELDSATEKAMPSAHLVEDIVVETYLLSGMLYAEGYVLFWVG
jgi:hypothetical protein